MWKELGEAFNVKNVKCKEVVNNDFVVLASVLLISLSDVKEGYLDDMKKKSHKKSKTD